MSTRRIKLVVSYDGTDFRGWAAQTGQRTVQSTLTEAVRRVTGEDVEVVGASRTDSGTHALGQVCHLDTSVSMEADRWPWTLNRVLDGDVAVAGAEEVASDFHSRFCADFRRYVYRIWTGKRDPFASRYVHDFGRKLNVESMRKASKALVGEHDFLAFTEELDKSVENTCRLLRKVEIKEMDQEVQIEIEGTAFLRGMMRRMSGALLEVGLGQRPVETVAQLLTEERESLQWPIVLPAKGLTLLQVGYADPPRDIRAASERA